MASIDRFSSSASFAACSFYYEIRVASSFDLAKSSFALFLISMLIRFLALIAAEESCEPDSDMPSRDESS